MEPLNKSVIKTQYGEKTLAVYTCDILDFKEEIDVLTFSAFQRSYAPTPYTILNALHRAGISAEHLSMDPELDMRSLCNVWLSRKIEGSKLPIKRLGCVEMRSLRLRNGSPDDAQNTMFASIRAYFSMLDIASDFGVEMGTVALPLLGAGSQGISKDLTAIPILNECIEFLKRNRYVKNVYIIDKNQANAFRMAMALEKSYSVMRENEHMKKAAVKPAGGDMLAFISYSSKDKNVADNLCAKLEANGIKAWYAPRDIYGGDYAGAIVSAITRCTHFIVIISKNSLASHHVLNEIDLAFRELNRNIKFMPLRIDEEDLAPAFTYYLSRQHWMDAHIPPIEARIDEFVGKILAE